MDDRTLWLKVVPGKYVIEFDVAKMYWQKNMTARDIASLKDLTVEVVKHIVRKIGKR